MALATRLLPSLDIPLRLCTNCPYSGAANGLGHPAVNNAGTNGSSSKSSGTKYRVLGGGQTIGTRCAPSLNGACVFGQVRWSLSYSVSVQPVVISVSGATTIAHRPNALIGQRLQFALQGGESVSFSGHSWDPSTDSFDKVMFGPYSAETPATRDTVLHSLYSTHQPNLSTVHDKGSVAGTAKTIIAQATAKVGQQELGPVSARMVIIVKRPEYSREVSYDETTYDPSSGVIGLTGPGGGYGFTYGAATAQVASFSAQGTGRFALVQLVESDIKQFWGGLTSTTNNPWALDDSWGYNKRWDACPATATPPAHYISDKPSWQLLSFMSSFESMYRFGTFIAYEPPFNGVGVEIVPVFVTRWHWKTAGARSSSGVTFSTAEALTGVELDQPGSLSLDWTWVYKGTL